MLTIFYGLIHDTCGCIFAQFINCWYNIFYTQFRPLETLQITLLQSLQSQLCLMLYSMETNSKIYGEIVRLCFSCAKDLLICYISCLGDCLVELTALFK